MIYYETELYHHGTMGQKWGKRLYQNKDGSLTPLGKLRYGSKGERLNKYKKKKGSSNKKIIEKNKTNTTEQKTKSVSEMSDDELNKKIARMRLEDTYSELSAKRIPPDKYKRIKSIAADLGEKAVRSIGKSVIDSIASKIEKQLNGNDVNGDGDDDKITDYNFKDITKVGDKKLKAAIDRLQNENQFKNAMNARNTTSPDYPPNNKESSKKASSATNKQAREAVNIYLLEDKKRRR